MHRAISGDLLNEEEIDKAMEEAGEEGIYHVRNTACNSFTFKILCIWSDLVNLIIPVYYTCVFVFPAYTRPVW